MAERLLDGSNIVAGFQQMGGKAMTQGMAGDVLRDAGLLGGMVDGLLQRSGVSMMAKDAA